MFKYVSLFSGIGGFEHALNAAGGDLVAHAEIDKFAVQSYNSFFGEGLNLGDVSKVDTVDVPDHDILTGGFPCQAFSVAGQRAGMAFKCNSCGHVGTLSFNQYADRDFTCINCFNEMVAVDGRGLMFFEIARIARDKQPALVIMENVKGLVGHDKGRTLDTIVRTMSEIGYAIDFEVLNSKFYGVPQNRERIFIMAVRKDIQPGELWTEEALKGQTVIPKGKRRIAAYPEVRTFNYPFPKNDTVEKVLADVLEDSVEESFYLDDEKVAKLVADLSTRYEDVRGGGNTEPKILRKERTEFGKNIRKDYEKGLLDISRHDMTEYKPRPDNISNTLTTVTKDNYLLENEVQGRYHVIGGLPVKEATKKGYDIAEEGDSVNFQFPDSKTRRGRVGKKIANTLEASSVNQGVVEALPMECENIQMVGMLDIKGNDQIRRVYSPEGQSPSITTMGGGNREPKIMEIGTSLENTLPQPLHFPTGEDVNNTLRTGGKGSLTAKHNYDHVAIGSPGSYRIRKLTPRECWRLQGFPEEAFEAAVAAGVSNSQLYKQAGNAVTVNVIEALIQSFPDYIWESIL